MNLAIRPLGVLEGSDATDPWAQEIARIKAAYVRRQNHELYNFFEPGYRLLAQERENKLLRALSKQGFLHLESAKILEVGCGTGAWLRDFIR